jgi:ribosomal-protein-serine acetyltransferase
MEKKLFCLPVDDEIKLCLLEPQLAPDLFALVDANRKHLRRWLSWVDSNSQVEHTSHFIRARLMDFANGLGLGTAIFYRGQLVGTLGTAKMNPVDRVVELGYWISAEYEGRGIITRACRTILRYLFAERGFNRVQIRCATGNHRSCAIPERLGFTREGILRQEGRVGDGSYVDLAMYSLLAEEWQQLKNS